MKNLLKSISYNALIIFLCLMMECAEEKPYPQTHQNQEKGQEKGANQVNKETIPTSPIDNTYAYAVSGVPILLNFTYMDLDPNYKISLKFTAGEYYYYDLFYDYGPDEVKKISLRLVDIETGEIQDTPYYDVYIGFYGHGWVRHADCQTPDNWSPTLWKGYKVTQVTILGSEGSMYLGPTAPVWKNRTEETIKWQ